MAPPPCRPYIEREAGDDGGGPAALSDESTPQGKGRLRRRRLDCTSTERLFKALEPPEWRRVM